MKLKASVCAIAGALLFACLAGCGQAAGPVPGGASAAAPTPEPAVSPAPAASSRPAASAPPTIEPAVSSIPASEPGRDIPFTEADQAAFLAFLQASNFFTSLYEELPSPQPLKNETHYFTIQRLISTYLRAMDRERGVETATNSDGVPYYPIATFELLTRQLFGLEVDYDAFARRWRTVDFAPDGMLCIPWGLDPGSVAGHAGADAVSYKDGRIMIQVDIAIHDPLEEEPPPVLRTLLYTFQYLPENVECPYRLESIQAVD